MLKEKEEKKKKCGYIQWVTIHPLKNKEILSCATIQTNLESILLSEINQTEKDKYSKKIFKWQVCVNLNSSIKRCFLLDSKSVRSCFRCWTLFMLQMPLLKRFTIKKGGKITISKLLFGCQFHGRVRDRLLPVFISPQARFKHPFCCSADED